MPATGVYLVMLLSIVLFAACFIFSGVLESGSPAPRLRTSFPFFLNHLAFASIASVALGNILLILLASNQTTNFPRNIVDINTFRCVDNQDIMLILPCLIQTYIKNLRIKVFPYLLLGVFSLLEPFI